MMHLLFRAFRPALCHARYRPEYVVLHGCLAVVRLSILHQLLDTGCSLGEEATRQVLSQPRFFYRYR